MDHATNVLIDELRLMDHRLAARLRASPASAHVVLTREAVEAFRNLARRMAARLQRQETEMGKAAQAIGVLQGQLTTAQANEYDAADLAAIQGVLGTPAAPANQSSGSPVTDAAPGGTAASGAGTDRVPASS